ncbi:MAG: dual specificity protein phosphatase family protein, partial [Solirubrobacteraceae bacterium]
EEYRPGHRAVIAAALASHGIRETRLSLIDYGHLPAQQLEQAVTTVVDWIKDGQRVYVHCRAGWQRSAAVAVGAVAVCDGLTIDAALDYVQQRKPSADPLPHQRDDLDAWWARRGAQSALD